MDKRIRILGLFLVLCFGLLFFQLNNWQVRDASVLQNSPYEPTPNVSNEPRGDIVSADGVVLAKSVPSNGLYKEQRVYPDGPLFADVTGYDDVTQVAETGLESEYDTYLIDHQSNAQNLGQLLTEHNGTDTVVTTISARLQRILSDALAGRAGAGVAIDPQTGAILAMYANPTFNPNVLSSHNATSVTKAFKTLQDLADPGHSPLINGTTQQTYPPGSTMKIVTTSAMFDHDLPLTQTVWPVLSATKLPDTPLLLHNFGGEKCGGALALILAQSCDTAFGLIGEALGAQTLSAEAKAFGFNQIPPLDLPAGEVSAAHFPTEASFAQNKPGLAYSAIGQEDVTETALQDALIASAIGDNGVIMAPHLLGRVVDDSGNVVTKYQPHPWLNATSSATASQVRNLMIGVATSGTAAGIFPPSLDVAAKTGTAETGLTNCSATWLVATAPAGPNDTPTIAVAAVLPAQSSVGCSETGAIVAGPIVQKVIVAALGSGQ